MDPQKEHHPGDRRLIENDESNRNGLQMGVEITSIDKPKAIDLMKTQPRKWEIDEDVLKAVDIMDRKLQEVRSEHINSNFLPIFTIISLSFQVSEKEKEEEEEENTKLELEEPRENDKSQTPQPFPEKGSNRIGSDLNHDTDQMKSQPLQEVRSEQTSIQFLPILR